MICLQIHCPISSFALYKLSIHYLKGLRSERSVAGFRLSKILENLEYASWTSQISKSEMSSEHFFWVSCWCLQSFGLGRAGWLTLCNPRTLGGQGGWIMRSGDQDNPGQHGETPSLLKIQKISWAWWHVPVIPATQEAEAGELLEPRRRRLRWAEIAPLHSSLGNKSETPSQKK